MSQVCLGCQVYLRLDELAAVCGVESRGESRRASLRESGYEVGTVHRMANVVALA